MLSYGLDCPELAVQLTLGHVCIRTTKLTLCALTLYALTLCIAVNGQPPTQGKGSSFSNGHSHSSLVNHHIKAFTWYQ